MCEILFSHQKIDHLGGLSSKINHPFHTRCTKITQDGRKIGFLDEKINLQVKNKQKILLVGQKNNHQTQK